VKTRLFNSIQIWQNLLRKAVPQKMAVLPMVMMTTMAAVRMMRRRRRRRRKYRSIIPSFWIVTCEPLHGVTASDS
jgi:hypothetical protein